MDNQLQKIKDLYSNGERFDEMQVYADKKLKIWENEISGIFPPSSKILDIGCGKGREAFCLDEKGFHLTGIDISETVIEAAKQIVEVNHLNIDFYVSSGLDLAFPESEFDVVIIWAQTFGLLYGENSQHHMLKECKRVLKDGGILSFSGHDKEFLQAAYPQYLKDTYFYPFYDSDLHYTTFTIEELSECAKRSGFQVMECKKGMVYTKKEKIIHCACRK